MVTDYKKRYIEKPRDYPVPSENVLDRRGKKYRKQVGRQINQIRKQESDRMAQEFGSTPGKPMGMK